MLGVCSVVHVHVLVLVACGGTPPPASSSRTAPTSPRVVAPPDGTFAFDELTVFVDGRSIARLTTDGSLEVHRSGGLVPAGSIALDGTLTSSSHGTVTRGTDGSFQARDGTRLFELDGDVLVQGDRRITIDDAGAVAGMPDHTRVAGVTVRTRRTALLLVGMLIELSNEPGRHGLPTHRD